MALTHEYRRTVLDKLKRNRSAARALYVAALNELLHNKVAEGLLLLRDLVHAGITFKELVRRTGFGEKALHRMLSRRGNPTTRNLVVVLKVIAADLGVRSHLKLA